MSLLSPDRMPVFRNRSVNSSTGFIPEHEPFNKISTRRRQNYEFQRKITDRKIAYGNLELLNKVINVKPTQKLSIR
jgi:hypothetical protein